MPYRMVTKALSGAPIRRIDLTFGALIIGLGLLAGIYAYGRGAIVRNPLVYSGWPYTVAAGPVHPGEALVTTITRCNEDDDAIVYSFSRAAYRLGVPDGEALPAFSLAGGFAILPPGCVLDEGIEIGRVPQSAEPGLYVIRNAAIVTREGRAFFSSWQSEPFEVAR